MIYVQLFLAFFKTGLFAVGGGLATLPFLYEISDTWHWFSHADIADMIAISESTPGAIGINMSTYAGFLTAGVPGGFIATLGLGTPCVIIILIIARILKKFKDNPYVEKAFYGLRAASIAMISASFCMESHSSGPDPVFCHEKGQTPSHRLYRHLRPGRDPLPLRRCLKKELPSSDRMPHESFA